MPVLEHVKWLYNGSATAAAVTAAAAAGMAVQCRDTDPLCPV